MLTNYCELYKRADKHLESDIKDLFEYEGKAGKESVAVACSISGMINACYTLRYAICEALQRNGGVPDTCDLSVLVDTLVLSDKYPFTEDDLEWAYEMDAWEEIYALKADGKSWIEPLTHDQLELIEALIYQLRNKLGL